MIISKPTFVVDENICKLNIYRMIQKAKKANVIFRPHFKTHQSAEIGNWFREQGVDKITVSSVFMATYFADHGWKNILIAFPVNILEMDQINALADRIELYLAVESESSVNFLANKLTGKAGIYIEIDEGYHRTGIEAEKTSEIGRLLRTIKSSDVMKFEGFMAHFGQTYSASTQSEVERMYNSGMKKLSILKHEFRDINPALKISVGDTPSCSLLEDFTDADEIRPGNFVFYDVMQYHIGSCAINDIAAALVCPVVAIYPDRNEFVVYGGAVHLSKESTIERAGQKIFGLVSLWKENRWGLPLDNTFVERMSQEHGIVKTTPAVIHSLNHGDLVAILPIHSCLTANLAEKYVTTGGAILKKV
ncbi:MAG: alanine racemase [Bacteroidales bacterium]|nr:alanine racemase [Bacteroidales bacterium]